MEDLLGIAFMAVMFFVAIYAKANKDAKRQQGQRPQWPGPVAPGPMYPRPQRPMMPPMPPKPTRQPAYPGSSQEGVRLDGVGSSEEGPRGDETVDAELQRFNRDIDRFEGQQLPQFREELEDRHLAELRSDIGAPAEAVPVLQVQTADSGMNLTGMLAERSSLAQAVVLAEVLGKPKALRGRR
ncbi:MAG: hypothetical protein ACM3XM_03620 [Mycobacterium leprae]